MFDAKICCFSTKVPQACFFGTFSLQPKQLQPDYVSSYQLATTTDGENGLNLLDIIIVNYNSTDYLLRCLRSVYDTLNGLSVRVFVQDNASEDNVERVKLTFPDVILSENTSNIGYSRAVNNAIKKGGAPYVVILNPDTRVTEGFFDCVLSYMDENKHTGILGPKVLNHDGSIQGSARSFPTPLTAFFGRSSLLSRLFPYNHITSRNVLTNISDGSNPMEVDWVSGACMLVRREALKDVGLMDERFFMYWEDADWCRRMWENGWKVVYFPQASIIHHLGVSSKQCPFSSVLEFHKSAYRLFDKHNKPSPFLKPLIIAGLSLRVPFALISNGTTKR